MGIPLKHKMTCQPLTGEKNNAWSFNLGVERNIDQSPHAMDVHEHLEAWYT